MAFGEELKREFDVLCRGITGKVKEETLFTQLVNAFNKLNCTYQVEIIHGNRWCVDFSASVTKAFYWRTGTRTRCELGDLLFIVTNGREVRLAIMQNKYDKTMSDYNSSFKVQMNQLYLLKERPEFMYKTNKYNVLKDAKLPSIGSFGTFRNDGNNYEMGYYCAECLKDPSNCSSPKSQRKIELKSSVNEDVIIGAKEQKNYCKTIADFGNALMNMKIGEPYSTENAMAILNNMNIIESLKRWDIPINYTFDIQRESIMARKIIILKSYNQDSQIEQRLL